MLSVKILLPSADLELFERGVSSLKVGFFCFSSVKDGEGVILWMDSFLNKTIVNDSSGERSLPLETWSPRDCKSWHYLYFMPFSHVYRQWGRNAEMKYSQSSSLCPFFYLKPPNISSVEMNIFLSRAPNSPRWRPHGGGSGSSHVLQYGSNSFVWG